MNVKLKKKNARFRDLTFGQPYAVIGIEADELRILNDAGRPFLYRPELFSLIDPREPVDVIPAISDLRSSSASRRPLDAREVIRLEGSWKQRLHTRAPLGLNEN